MSAYLTVREVAQLAGCADRTVRDAIYRGDIDGWRRGGRNRLFIHANAARDWANQRDGGTRPSVAVEEFARMRREAPDEVAVYVIQAGQNGPVKIGHVSNVTKLIARIRSIQTGCPEPLYLRRLIQTTTDARLESELHDRFAEWRLEGEWFAPSPYVLEFANGAGS